MTVATNHTTNRLGTYESKLYLPVGVVSVMAHADAGPGAATEL